MSSYNYIVNIDDPVSEVKKCGHKFLNLTRLNTVANVPLAVAISPKAFIECLSDENIEYLESYLNTLKSNGGYQLTKIYNEMASKIDNLTFTEELQKELRQIFLELTNGGKSPVIVRSSSPFEDSNNVSGAGIYESIGNISREEDFYAAIFDCWKSFFSLSALAHRLRIKEYDLKSPPALIVQKYVNASISGVTFSSDPISSMGGILIEYSDLGGDLIESGLTSGKRIKVLGSKNDYKISDNDLQPNLLASIISVTTSVEQLFGKAMEFEWVVENSELYVVQARPITTKPENFDSSGVSDTKLYNSYDDYDYLIKEDLGEVTEVYRKSINKRKTIRDLAVVNNIEVHGVAVLQTDSRGCKDFDLSSHKELNRLNTPLLVIDVGPHIRAFYTKRTKFNETLKTLLSHTRGKVSVIVREFASGEFSCISSMVGSKCVIEVCRGSLIGINRGFVETNTFQYDFDLQKVEAITNHRFPSRYYDFSDKHQCFMFKESDDEVDIGVINHDILKIISNFTRTVSNQEGPTSLEWTILGDTPVFIDHTVVDSSKHVDDLKLDTGSEYFLSGNTMKGKAHLVSELDRLEYISSGPTLNVAGHLPTMEANKEIMELIDFCESNKDIIIVSKHPYTAFSAVVDKVNGFIFESGPLLCHLSIVCREQGVPIAIINSALTKFEENENISI